MTTQACRQCGKPLSPTADYCLRCGHDTLVGDRLPGGVLLRELVMEGSTRSDGRRDRVYEAEQSDGRVVSANVYVLPEGDEDGGAERFLDEARVLHRVQHPNVAAVLEFGRLEAHVYLTVELPRGRRLDRILREDGLLPLPAVVEVMTQVLAGLGEMHRQGVRRPLLTPYEILVEPTPSEGCRVKLIGLDEGASTRINPSERLLGCPPYFMAPELRRKGTADHRADLYACGGILLEMLTGVSPSFSLWAQQDPGDILKALRSPWLAPPRRFERRLLARRLKALSDHLDQQFRLIPCPRVPRRFAEIVLRATAGNPDQRFQTADEFADALRAALPSS